MRLSEAPEGVFYYAVYEQPSNTFEEIVRRIDGKVQRDHAAGCYSSIPATEWFVKRPVEVVENPVEDITSLRARIAELEAALAKATRPAPAVGQVWRSKDGKQFVVMRDYENVGGFVVASETLDAIPNMKDPLMAGDTYVGIWDGKFNVVKESAE